jgi:hypothetical protein
METGTAALSGDNGASNASANEGQASAWNAGFDEDTNAYVDNKGWGGVEDVLSSYKNLEKFQGGAKNLIEMPGVDASDDDRSSFFNKLGRPETADQYSSELPEGGDSDFFNWFRDTAHAQGMTDSQASGLLTAYEEMNASRMEAYETGQREASEKAIGDLQKEWGQGYDAQMDMGKRAVAALGYDEQSLTDLEGKMGTSEMLKLFANLGSKMGEDSFEDGSRGSSNGSFGLTPATARQQMSDLKLDKSFMGEYLGGNPDAVSKMKRLMEAAHG